MKDNIFHTMQEYQMLSVGDTVIVGVSGGADSMSLLHFLSTYQKEFCVQIIAAHVNHHLRGAEADRDQRFVQDWCLHNGIPCFVAHCPVKILSEQHKMGEEECGRCLRYGFFSFLADCLSRGIFPSHEIFWNDVGFEVPVPSDFKIATAHTLSDNIETILFHIARGCGGRGLCGIPPMQNGIIRPLIEVTRQQVEEYCNENEIGFVNDSTNAATDYTRNRLRHCVVPQFEEINPAFSKTMQRMIFQQNQDETYLQQQAQAAMSAAKSEQGYCCQILLSYPQAVRSRALILIAKCFGVKSGEFIHYRQLDAALSQGGAVNFPGNITLYSDKNHVFPYLANVALPEKQDMLPICLQTCMQQLASGGMIVENRLKLFYLNIETQNLKENFQFVHKKDLTNCLNYGIIPKKLIVRSRQAGDTFCLAYRKVRKSLKKWMNELHIPQEERDRLLLLEGDGEILWVEKLGVSEKARVTSDTKQVLFIQPI